MNKLSAHIFAIALIGVGLLLGTASIAQMANANGILVRQAQPSLWSKEGLGDAPRVQVFVNLPLHDAAANTYNKSNVPFSYKVTWAVCDNEETGVRIITRYDVNGGLHSNVNGDSNTQWKEVSQQTHSEGKCGGGKYCFTSRSYSSNGINMSDVKGNHTTLQVIAKTKTNIKRPYVLPDSSIPANPDIYNSYDGHTIVNIHLHWAQAATPTPTPAPNPVFSCAPANQTVEVNKWIGVYEEPSGGLFSASWVAPGAQVTSKKNGTGFSTWYTTPGDKVITATSISFPGGTKTATCKVKVVPGPTNAPTPKPTIDPTPAPTPATVTCLQNGKEIVITTSNTNINCNNISNVVNVTVDNSSNNSSNNSSSNNNEVNVEQKVEVKAVAKKKPVAIKPTPAVIAPVAVPVTAKTGVEGVVAVTAVTLLGGSGLAYLIRKSLTSKK